MTDEDRRRILREAREILKRPIECYEPPPEPLRYKTRDEPFELAPAPEPKLDAAPATRASPADAADWSQWEAWVQARIADALKAERKTICKIVAQAMATFVGNEREQINRECAKLNSAIEELHRLLASDKAKVIDLPNFRRTN
jgi:hypothetical protein